MSKFSKKLISSIVPAANTAGIYNAAEQLQNLNALAITAVNFCADSSGTDGGLGDDTAINTAGGFVKLTGSGFTSATIVYINGISVTKYYINTTTIVATVPAATAGTTVSLIVFNGSTVGSIWAAGISYSGFPSWTTTAASNLGLVVSTQLVATGDAPLTYTFVSGTLPPNCTISSSGLLSGTVTGVSTNAIYTFTVAVTDAQNQNVSQSIVYTLVVSDQYYRYTSLHISGDSNPTWITDASTNALAVTSAGAPQSTTFSPLKAGYYGNSFNGTTDYLTTPSVAGLAMGTGDFTIELWYYPQSADKGISQISTTSGGFLAGNTNTIALFIGSTNNLGVYASGTTTYGGNNKLPYNAWTHIALVRISGVTKAYINGILDTSFASGGLADTTNYTGTYAVIGGYYSTSYLSNGYISNFRIVKGTAVYTANFTPSATPLTAITNTSLLTCQSNRFIDNSAAPATITVAGTPKVVSSNPFNLPSGLAAYGAGYFNGSSDYVTIPNSTLFYFGSGNYTVEAWVYPLTTSATSNVILNQSVSNATSNSSFYLGFATDGVAHYVSSGTGWTYYAAASGSYAGRWSHVAWVRNGDTIYAYVNGTLAASTALSAGFSLGNSTRNIEIGTQATTGYTIAYISNLRVVKGTAVYTAAFTPPTAPLTAITNTSLLTLQTNVPHNNSQFRDTSTNNALITRFGNVTQGSFSPFTKQYPYSTATVGGSAYFDGTGDYLAFPNDSAFSFGLSNFTIECWINVTSTSNYHIYVNSDSANNLGVTLYVGSGTLYTYVTAPAGNIVYGMTGPASSVVSGVWTHVAFVRNGSTFTNYVNGVAGTSVTSASAMPDSQVRCYIGTTYNASTSFSGYISNLRVVKGTALYTSNFTPPTAPLTAVSGTVLLMPFTDAAVYDNTMLNNIETVGDTQVNTSTFKYGTGALKFDGTGDYITVSGGASSLHSIQSGAFTVEMWIYRVGNSSGSGTYDALIGSNNVGSAVWGVYVNKNTLAVSFYSSVGLVETTTTISNSVWTHIAVSRTTGNNLQIFINGVSGYSASNTGIGTLVNPLYIGADVNNNTFNGYIDELRITKGYARYTTTFTPSTGAFSASAPFGTSVLPSKSLRFRASASAYLSKTFGTPSNSLQWTWSGWVKRGRLGAGGVLFQGYSSVSVRSALQFNSSDQLLFNGAVATATTTAVFRDPAAWYHIMCVYDSANPATSNRLILYVNGVRQTVTGTQPTASQVEYINSAANIHYLSAGYSGAWEYHDGEMAEVNFVDGLALDPTMFGAYSAYNQWLPVSYSGYMGANGFYLPLTADTFSTIAASYLIVAGGGSGAGGSGGGAGGGGAGGLLYSNSYSITPGQTYTVTVGAGGQASNRNSSGYNGSNSQFGSLIAIGGGGGGSNVTAGVAGGSGGGSGEYATPDSRGYGGAGTAGQGYAGGNTSVTGVASGGGGAGGLGGNGSASAPGSGGIGLQFSISGTSQYYAGGGGASGNSLAGAAGGSGVGGNGGAGYGGVGTVTSGAASTGSGGGGIYIGASGAGGSGIVIVSYPGTQKLIGGTVTSVSGNTIHTFTTSGTLINPIADTSGNFNNWTPNNINVSTVGPTYDLLTDVPTLTSTTVANYAVLNPLDKGTGLTLSNANLTYATSGVATAYMVRATVQIPATGKYYWEATVVSGTPLLAGIATANANVSIYLGQDVYGWGYYTSDGKVYNNNATLATYSTATTGDVIGFAFSSDAQTFAIYKNNTIMGTLTGFTLSGTYFPAAGSLTSGGNFNFGQQPFTYTPPTGFLPLNTFNI